MTAFQLNRKSIALFIAGIIFLVFAFVNFSKAQQNTGLQILLSGKLTNSENIIAQDGRFNMNFSLYETASSTDNIWSEIFSGDNKIAIEQGIFQISLGLQNPLNLDFDNNTYWLGIKIGGIEETPQWDEEMAPRIQVTTLKNLLFNGKVSMTEEELVKALVDEFEKSATSSEQLSQTAFINFLKQKLGQAGTSAVIISPNTISLLLEQILELQQKYEQGQESKTFWRTLLDFFTRIFDAISEKLGKISVKIEEIFYRLTNIEKGVDKIINILENQSCQPVTQINTTVSTTTEQQPNLNYDSNYLVEDFGKTILKTGEKTIRVFSVYITENTKIFVLPEANNQETWWISDKKIGEYFEISIISSYPNDLTFEYWLIVPKNELPQAPVIEPTIMAPSTEEKTKESIPTETQEIVPVEETSPPTTMGEPVTNQ
jgi:hypothetical protein